ncbi:unnamed protein product [Adineta ricciae]|uniref:Uncharacterized protein n=1 Tax=Adineta ricciae TaxID=249248 RepID=A0A815ACD1_ADIRI|nr:unnamed protein product [Adineta ricciae]
MPKMLSGKGYCTQPTCFPVLGAPPIHVFLCKTHCEHMLCYRHWLSHQTSGIDEKEDLDHSSSTVTLDSDAEEQKNVPDLLKECTNQEDQHLSEVPLSMKNSNYFDGDENKEIVTSHIQPKEIEWWNEITPWKNDENFNVNTTEEFSDEEYDYVDQNNRTDDSDYDIKTKRRTSKKKLGQSMSCGSYLGECPLTFDGAFGLFQDYHQHQLCTKSKGPTKKICLYQHFNSKHGFKRQVSIRLVKAMIYQQDPSTIKCPLAINDPITNMPCSTQEITRKSIRRHLSGVHRLDSETINKLMKQIYK